MLAMTSGLTADSDKAWEGPIYYKHKGKFVARYEAYWGVVRRESSRGLQRIDLFKQQSAVQPTSDLFIPLHDVLHVLNREARARKFAFQVLGAGCKYHLATESAKERNRWVQGLESLRFGPPQPGVIYEHQVLVIPNSHSEKLHLSGRYILRIADSHIALFTSTGTLPTRFLYSLSDITRTRYTNFTNASQKFSVLVLYCKSDDVTQQQTQDIQSHDTATKRHSCGMVGDEGMFVFQTQNASTISRTIDHRARDMAKKDGCSKQTALKSRSSLSSLTELNPTPWSSSLPTCTTTPLNEEHLLYSDHEKPPPPSKLTRNSPTMSVLGEGSALEVNSNAATTSDLIERIPEGSGLNVKPRKTPIPLPRKKYSLDSSAKNRFSPSDNQGYMPKAKPRPFPPPKPKSRSANTLGNSNHVGVNSATSPSSPNSDPDTNCARGSSNEVTIVRPTYMNLSPADTDGRNETEIDEEIKGVDDVPEDIHVNLSSSKSCELLATRKSTPDGAVAPHERYYNLSSYKSSDCLMTSEKSTIVTQQRYYNLSGKEVTSSLPDPELLSSPDQSPTLDDFLARILQRRRDSRDANEECDEKQGDGVHHRRYTSTRTRSTGSKLVMRSVDRPGHANTQPTPHYYNLANLLGGRGSVEEEEEQSWSEEDGELMVRETDTLSLSESVGEKEYRSEWLTRVSEVHEELQHLVRMESVDSNDPPYLQILPSAIHQPQKSPIDQTVSTRTPDVIDAETQSTEPRSSVVSSPSTPGSGSPLWGTCRPWSRQRSLVSLGGKEDSSNGEPVVPLRYRPLVPKRISQKLLSTARSRATNTERAAFLLHSVRRASKKYKMGPLPSLPLQLSSDPKLDIDSDYEWAEVGEVMSDAGSDYHYTEPPDFQPLTLGSSPKRSASCSDLTPFVDMPNSHTESKTFESPEHISIGHRPPAPLPTFGQDLVLTQNIAHLESPQRSGVFVTRTNSQRSHSLDHWDHFTDGDLDDQEQYDYVRNIEDDYDYAAVPNRSTATLFPNKEGHYVDINRRSSSDSVVSPSPSSSPPNSGDLEAPPPPPRLNLHHNP